MAKLTVDQKKIIDSLKKEFEKINDTTIPISSGLIDVAQIKQEVIDKNQFLQECEAEKTTNARIIDRAVRADAEKLRGDLNQLGLDVSYRNDGLCASSFYIVDKKDIKKELIYISYNYREYETKNKFGLQINIPQGYTVGMSADSYGRSWIHKSNIEDLVATERFKERVKYAYENLDKK